MYIGQSYPSAMMEKFVQQSGAAQSVINVPGSELSHVVGENTVIDFLCWGLLKQALVFGCTTEELFTQFELGMSPSQRQAETLRVRSAVKTVSTRFWKRI